MVRLKRLIASLVFVITILGCILSVFSIILPFYKISSSYSHGANFDNTYWSFKCESIGGVGVITRNELIPRDYSLFYYWFGDIGIASFTLGSFKQNVAFALIGTFALQVLSVALSLALIRFRKRALLTALFCLSLVILLLMTYVAVELTNGWQGTIQLGYWLVFISCGLFLVASSLTEFGKNRKEHALHVNAQCVSETISIPVTRSQQIIEK